MSMIKRSCLLMAVLLTNPTLAGEPDAHPPTALWPVGVNIHSLQYNGTGCPAGSSDIQANFESEGQTLTLELPEMIAEWGPEIAKVEARKNCMVSLGLGVPEGWQFAMAGFETRGFMSLDAGMKGEVTLQNFFEGSPGAQRFPVQFTGPRQEDFIIKDLFPLSTLLWSTCGLPRKMNINFAVKLTHADPQTYPNAQGLLILGSHWLSTQIKTGLVWRRCN